MSGSNYWTRHQMLRVLLGGLLVCMLGSQAQTLAQESQPTPPDTQPHSAAQPTPEQPVTPLGDETEVSATLPKREGIQDRITQIQAATDLPETVKTELLGLYRRALEQLTIAENWETKTREFENGRERAPELLKEAKARIEQLTTRPSTQPAPEVSPDDTIEVLSQKLATKEMELRAAQDAARKLDEEAKNRAARRVAIPDLLADANRRLERISGDLGVPPPAGTLPQVALARRTLLLSQKRAVELEVKEYEAELRYYEARSALLTARREEARLTAATAQTAVTTWQDLVSQRRQTEIERQKQVAEEELRRAPAAVRELIEKNKGLADEWATVGQRIKTLQDKLKTVTDLLDKLSREFTDLSRREQEDPDALAEIIGPEMRRKREELFLLRGYEREFRALKKESARVERRAWEIDEEVIGLADLEPQVAEKVNEILEATPNVNRNKIESRVTELYSTRRDSLKQMQPDYHAYAEDLRELRAAMAKALAKAGQSRAFIDQHILWLRSTGPFYTARLPHDWLRGGPRWLATGRALLNDAASRPAIYVLAFIVFATLFGSRRRIQASLREISQRVARPMSDRYELTLQAAAYALLLSAPWAALLWFVGWRIGSAVDAADAATYELAQAAASGLRTSALVLWTLTLLRQVCRPKGLAETHFRWDPAAVRLARRAIDSLVSVAVLVTFIVYATENHAVTAWRGSLGRAAFIVGMIALAVVLQRLLRPSTGVLANRLRRHQTSWLYNLRYIWFPLAVIAPLVLAVTSAVGYHYTAIQFSEDLVRTSWLLLGVILLHALLVRWLFVAQRRLAIKQARKRRAAAEAAKAADQPPAGETLEFDEAKLDLVTVGDQTKRLLLSMAAVALFLGLWVIWADMLPALSFMHQIQLWPHTVAAVPASGEGAAAEAGAAVAAGGTRVEYITLAHLAMAIVIAIVTYILAKNIPGLLEIAILQRLPLDTGARYAITALARYTIVAIGTVAAFGAIGVGWSKVQWLVAAITVGLGFGLQEIFANFVSGLMLLFERPIRIGDTVTVGDVSGTVTRIRIRATTITNWDRKELVIPNREFVTGQVINWTLSDTTLRITLPVGIAYGSDIELAERTLLNVAKNHASVLATPEPYVLFTGFGDSALSFELRIYVASVEHLLKTRHDLNKAIDAAFRKARIEIAFPQQDVHVRSIEAALPITDQRRAGKAVPSEAESAGTRYGSTGDDMERIDP